MSPSQHLPLIHTNLLCYNATVRPNLPMASSASVSPAATFSGTHHRRLLPCFLHRLPRPRSRPRSRLHLAACHADILLSSSGVQASPAPAACSSASSAGGFSDWLLTHGLPPGKVAILERPVPCSRGGKDRPLHYVAAGQDLEVLTKHASLLTRVVNMRSLCG